MERTCGNCKLFFPKTKFCKGFEFRCSVCEENKACERWQEEKPLVVNVKVKHSRGSFMPYFSQYYCPHCKRQLGWLNAKERPDRCTMCGKMISWKGI